MTIQAVYDHYQLMPNLQLHQYRVAGVAKLVCDSLSESVDTDNVIKACLLHDMGNILKFDLSAFPQFLEPQGLEYWQKVKADFSQKYGNDEHEATFVIAAELGVSERVFELIGAVGFDEIRADFESGDLGKMICEYADCRVAPLGVVSIEERLNDLEQRYASHYPSPEHTAKRREFQELAKQMEKKIFEQTSLKPNDITEQTIQISSLKKFSIDSFDS